MASITASHSQRWNERNTSAATRIAGNKNCPMLPSTYHVLGDQAMPAPPRCFGGITVNGRPKTKISATSAGRAASARVECDLMNHLSVAELIHVVERHGYALLFFWVLAEQGALPIPSVPLLVAVGALIRTGSLHAVPAMACCLAGALAADTVWFYFGRTRGKRVLRFICRVSLEPDSCVRQTENAFLRYGLNTLLLAKFVPGLNAVAAPLAGDSGVALPRFLAIDSLGIAIWSGTYIGVGYLFSDQVEEAIGYVQQLGSGVLILLAALLAAWIFWKFIQRRRFLKKLEVARITPEELRDRLEAGEDLFIADLRTALHNDLASVPGAVRFSIEDVEGHMEQIPRDREIILFCS
jgi:membrane protein DedA with SNARE-associated domain